MLKDCCILFQPIFWIRLITVGTLTIHIHILKTVDNWLCLLIFPNNWKKQKRIRWKLWFILFISFWSIYGLHMVFYIFPPPPRKTNMVHPKYADLGRCRPFRRGITPLRGLTITMVIWFWTTYIHWDIVFSPFCWAWILYHAFGTCTVSQATAPKHRPAGTERCGRTRR